MKLIKVANKLIDPVYFYRPSQIVKRLRHFFLPTRKEKCVHLPWGGILSVKTTEKNGRTILHRGLKELVVTESCFRLAESGAVHVDAGANIGHMTSAIAHASNLTDSSGRENGTVHAFEPHPVVFERLQRNVIQIRKEVPNANVQAHNVALTNKNGTLDLYIPHKWSENEGLASLEKKQDSKKVEVKANRLDNIISSPIQLLKLDVEGHEYSALNGCKKIIKNKIIKYVIFEDFNIQDSRTRDFLQAHGYSIFAVQQTLRGPHLTRRLNGPQYNFIAAIDAAACKQCFSASGWRCLRNK